MSLERYYPLGLQRSDFSAVIGLISDTHMPLRRRHLPPNLGDVLGGVDLLLHAGDVGELWTLDLLSSIAPVVAVHGNDETEDAQRELPYKQVITVAGQRILLWHSHFPVWEDEMASREHNDLRRSIQRSVDQATEAGAKIVVFGHWHIPLVYRTKELLIINPGALASGNEFTRMLINTVAILFIQKNGTAHVVHIDLASPETPYIPQVDWDAGFAVMVNRYAKSIISPELAPAIQYMRGNFSRTEIEAIRPLIAAKAMPIWEQAGGDLTLAAVDDALRNTTELSPELHEKVIRVLNTLQNSK